MAEPFLEPAAARVLAFSFNLTISEPTATMEVNQLKRQLKDLSERIESLRGFL